MPAPEVPAGLGAAWGPAEESTFRRAFALLCPDVLDQVLGAWLQTRAARAGGRLVIAVDSKAVRGAKGRDGKAPHLVAALAHGIGAILGQVAVEEKSNEIPAVRDLLKAFADLAGAVITIDALCRLRTVLGLVLGSFETVGKVLEPFITAVNGIPKIALAPLFLLFFGIGQESKIALAAVGVSFVLFCNVYLGLRTRERELVQIV